VAGASLALVGRNECGMQEGAALRFTLLHFNLWQFTSALIKGTAQLNTPFAPNVASAQLTIRVTVEQKLLRINLQICLHSIGYTRTKPCNKQRPTNVGVWSVRGGGACMQYRGGGVRALAAMAQGNAPPGEGGGRSAVHRNRCPQG
jgi:hypothetical protein